jgi:hypothetical protein
MDIDRQLFYPQRNSTSDGSSRGIVVDQSVVRDSHEIVSVDIVSVVTTSAACRVLNAA